ncbi:hypothetical protein AA0616_1817 [Komagataeibacter nataicola NRIC 0616]|nr:hypothetical protein AA0616_1817 [Komagataeibacter nataicola NRIC 0616]
MSAFALPISPERVTPSPSQTYGTLRYRAFIECTHSFGTWLEPRYIFGARFLLDQ